VIYSAWLSGIASLSVLFHSWLQSGLVQDTPTPRVEGHARQISHSDSRGGTLLPVLQRWLYHAPVFTEIAASHRLKRTLVNPLCLPE